MSQSEAGHPNRRRKVGRSLLAAGLLAVASVVGIAWWQGLFNPEPEAATLEASADALTSTSTSSPAASEQPEAETTSPPSATTHDSQDSEEDGEESQDSDSDDASQTTTKASQASDSNSEAPGGTYDGQWEVVPGEVTYAGYRTDSPTGEVVGRSPGVSGSLTIADDAISAAEIVVDMTQLKSDSSIRDDHLGSQGIEHRNFPTSTFVLTEPIQLEQEPAEGDRLSFQAKGDLTVRDITKPTTVDLEGAVIEGQLLVVGSTEVDLEEFGAAISATSSATMEFSVVFGLT